MEDEVNSWKGIKASKKNIELFVIEKFGLVDDLKIKSDEAYFYAISKRLGINSGIVKYSTDWRSFFTNIKWQIGII